ncbi:MAG TPA: hypothetical protein VE779_04715 [Candidatus Angelobacter sp.]|nr:hypothetical protein [Candidatus Angelobacter sp.]
MKKLVAAVLLVASWIAFGTTCRAQTASAQESSSNGVVVSAQVLDLLRKDLRAKRQQLIAANLKLTEAEGERFWPVYGQYLKELSAINDKKWALIQNYADNYGKMANDEALLFTRQWLDVDIAATQLRQKYVPTVAKVLDGKKAATFFQLDRRIAMMLDLQVTSQIPLIDSQ